MILSIHEQSDAKGGVSEHGRERLERVVYDGAVGRVEYMVYYHTAGHFQQRRADITSANDEDAMEEIDIDSRANGHNEKRIVANEDSKLQTLVATDNIEDINWTKEFDAEPVTFAMIALTEVEQDDWSMKFDEEHVHFGQDGLGIDELAIRNKVLNQENTQPSQPEIDTNKVIIEDWVDSDDEETVLNFSEIQQKTALNSENSETSFENRSPRSQDSVGQGSRKKGVGHKGGKTCFVCYSPDHLIKDCNLHERTFKQTQPHKPKGTQGSRDTRPVWNNINRVNHSNFLGNSRYPHQKKSFIPSAVLTREGLKSTARPKVTRTVPSKSTANVFYQDTARSRVPHVGNPEEDLKDYAIIDSGCSGSMTGDKDKLSDYGQDKYVKDILNKFDFRTIKPASTPIEAHKSLGKDEEGEEVDVYLYRFQVTPKVRQHTGCDYARDNHDRRSTLGGCQYLGRRLVSWQCKKQTIVAISSTEAEYVAAASCCAQVTVICVDNTTLLAKTGVYIAQAMAIALYCDEKIKAHPDNMVALVPMGALQGTSYVKPTRDLNEILSALKGTDNQEKDEKQSQNDKTGLGMEKTVKDKAKSKPESQSSQKVNWSKSKSTQVNPEAKVKEI
ncbi:hypothetical protein Tco_1334865 [Tanacetum coccineum]